MVMYMTVCGTVLALVAALAITTQSAAPPSIAAFAPEHVQEIKHPPPNQSGLFGNPGGAPAGGGGLPTPTPTPSPSPSVPLPPQAASFNCVGNPPRQTFDPQSPPCISGWVGDNGGATAPGVTANEVRYWIYGGSAESDRILKDLETYFNLHFEMYGRKLHIINEQQPGTGNTCSSRQAAADWVAKQAKAFAAGELSTDAVCWYGALARDHVISVNAAPQASGAQQSQLAPYVWSYTTPGEDLMAGTGEMICKQLAGKKATYSPDPVLQNQTRTFGLINGYDDFEQKISSAPLEQALSKCGVKLKDNITIEKKSSDDNAENSQDTADAARQAQQAVLQMQRDNVSTVIMFGLDAAIQVSASSQAQNYNPEWILLRGDANSAPSVSWRSRDKALLEVTGSPRQVPIEKTSYVRALQEVDPGYCPCSSYVSFFYGALWYESLLMFVSGVQMAGPHLTPSTFERGLQRTTFPNPPDPLNEGTVSFAGRHAMIDDLSIAWWNPNAASPYPGDSPGTWCYANGGQRYKLGSFPTQPVLPADLQSGPCVN